MPRRFNYPLNGHLNPPMAVNRVLDAVDAYAKENEQWGLKFRFNNKRAGYRNVKFHNVWPEDRYVIESICNDNGVSFAVREHKYGTAMPSLFIPTNLEYKRHRGASSGEQTAV